MIATDIHTTVLPGGVPVVIEPIAGVRSCALSWLVPAGFIADPADRLGVSAVLAEMVLRGSAGRGSREDADLFDRLGVSRGCEVNATTLRLGATMLGSQALEALGPITDLILRPNLDADALEPCRDLALQALASLQDDPQERAVLAARARHQTPPYDRTGLGTEDGLTALTHADVRAAWTRGATPTGGVLALAGALEPAAIIDRLGSLLAGWSGRPPEIARGTPAPRGYGHIDDPTNQVQIVVVHDAPPETSDEAALERALVAVLSGGMSGRLFSEVREKRGLCYAVSAGYRGDKDFGLLTAYVGTTPERAQESLDVLLEQLAHIGTPGGAVTPEEFERAIVGLKSNLIFAGESTSARASALAADYRRLGRARSLAELAARYDAMTLDELNAYARARAQRQASARPTIQTLGPAALRPPAGL